MIDTRNNALIPTPITRDVSTRINTPNSLSALSKEILETVLAYSTPYEMGRILSTCRSLRFSINSNERLWEIAARILGTSKSSEADSFRKAVITVEQLKKGIFWDNSWKLDYEMVPYLKYRIQAENYSLHISNLHEGVTWDRLTRKKLREIKIPNERRGAFLVYHDNIRSIFLRPTKAQGNPIGLLNTFEITIYNLNNVMTHTFFINENISMPEVFSKGKAFVTYSTLTGVFSIYNIPEEKGILIAPVDTVTGINFQLFGESFNILSKDNIYQYYRTTGTFRERLIDRNFGSNLKDMSIIYGNLMRLTATHLICDRRNGSNNWVEVWRVSATANKIIDSHVTGFVGILEGITNEKCSIYTTTNGQKLTTVELKPDFPANLFSNCLEHFTNLEYKEKFFGIKFSLLLNKMDEQQKNREKAVKHSDLNTNETQLVEKPIVQQKSTLRKVVEVVASFFVKLGLSMAMIRMCEGKLDKLINYKSNYLKYPLEIGLACGVTFLVYRVVNLAEKKLNFGLTN